MRLLMIALVLVHSVNAQVEPKIQLLKKKLMPARHANYFEGANDWGEQGILFEWSEEIKGRKVIRHYDLYDSEYQLKKSLSTELMQGFVPQLTYDKWQTEDKLTFLYAPFMETDGVAGQFTVIQINRKSLVLAVSSGSWPGPVDKFHYINDKIYAIGSKSGEASFYMFDINSEKMQSLSCSIPNVSKDECSILDLIQNQSGDGFILPVLHYSDEINNLYLMYYDINGVPIHTDKIEKENNVSIEGLSATASSDGACYLIGSCIKNEVVHLFTAKKSWKKDGVFKNSCFNHYEGVQ